jgi:hypothetical protein
MSEWYSVKDMVPVSSSFLSRPECVHLQNVFTGLHVFWFPVPLEFSNLPLCPKPRTRGGQLGDLGSVSSCPVARAALRFRAWAAGMHFCSHGAAWLGLRRPLLGE